MTTKFERYLNHFTPLGRKVLVERVDVTLELSSGLVVPEVFARRAPEGHVRAMGLRPPGDEDLWEVAPGDHVLVGQYGGVDLEGALQIIPESGLLAIIDAKAPHGIVPLGKYVLVCMMPPEKQTAGGIVIPDKFQGKLAGGHEEFGVVVEIGGKVKLIEPDWRVHVARTSGTFYRAHGNDYVLVEESKLHSIVL